MQKNKEPSESYQYVGPYRLEKTLGKGQTGKRYVIYNLENWAIGSSWAGFGARQVWKVFSKGSAIVKCSS